MPYFLLYTSDKSFNHSYLYTLTYCVLDIHFEKKHPFYDELAGIQKISPTQMNYYNIPYSK